MKGNLYKGKMRFGSSDEDIVRVESTYDKTDIDPDCPESVAIIGMVKVTILSGDNIGKSATYRRSTFNRIFKALKDSE
jgi:hypothetical protein